MKLVVECEVDSDTILPRRQELKKEGRTFCFETDQQGRWNKLKVVADVPDPSRFEWGLEPVPEPRSPNQAPASVRANADPELLASVTKDIQCLESTISVFFSVRSLNWRYPTLNVIFEEGDPRDPTWGNLYSLHWEPGKPAPTKAGEKEFITVACLGLSSESLMVVESFWRGGENDVVDGKYINAFVNFYFILEGMFGNWKTKNKDIARQLKGSSELHGSIFAYLADTHPGRHIEQLVSMLRVKDNMPDAECLIDLLVSTRGKLHHFQNNPNRPQGSPLAHDEYEGIAMFTRYLAHKAVVSAATKIKACGFKELST